MESFLDSIELLVIINKDEHIAKLMESIKHGLSIIDFVGMKLDKKGIDYEGICW